MVISGNSKNEITLLVQTNIMVYYPPGTLKFEHTYEESLEVLRHNGSELRFLQDQTQEQCLTAVQTHGSNLAYVKNRTPEVCMAAVQNDGSALRYVIHQTPELCWAAVNKSGLYLRYVYPENRTPELVQAAQKDIERHENAKKSIGDVLRMCNCGSL